MPPLDDCSLQSLREHRQENLTLAGKWRPETCQHEVLAPRDAPSRRIASGDGALPGHHAVALAVQFPRNEFDWANRKSSEDRALKKRIGGRRICRQHEQ